MTTTDQMARVAPEVEVRLLGIPEVRVRPRLDRQVG
jgi:hypothetical protein